MAFSRVTKLKCISNINSEDEVIALTIGNIYMQQYNNADKNSKEFGVFDDNGMFKGFDSGFFEVYAERTRENTGWEIQCNDCLRKLTIDEFNQGKCPKCGQYTK